MRIKRRPYSRGKNILSLHPTFVTMLTLIITDFFQMKQYLDHRKPQEFNLNNREAMDTYQEILREQSRVPASKYNRQNSNQLHYMTF